MGGIAISEETSPWAHAFTAGTITTADQASNALAAARTLASHTLPATDARVRQIGDDSALTTPATVEEWMERIDLLDGVAKTLAVFGPAVFDAPLQEMAASLAPGSGGPFRRLRARLGDGAYRSARKSALKLWTADKPRPETLHAAVVSAAGQLTSWRKAACGDSRPHVPSGLEAAAGSLQQLRDELQALAGWAGSAPLTKLSMSDLAAHLSALLADTQTVSKLPRLAHLRSSQQAAGVWPMVEECRTRNLTVDQALASFEHVWLSSILDTVSLADSRIGAFDGQAHSRSVIGFAAADRTHIGSTPVRIQRAVAENVTRVRDAYPKESDVVTRQAHLKRGHLPVRQLFQAAPHVLSALRPCWVMSPLVVSQLLPAECIFDVVIFDEASQVTPPTPSGR